MQKVKKKWQREAGKPKDIAVVCVMEWNGVIDTELSTLTIPLVRLGLGKK